MRKINVAKTKTATRFIGVGAPSLGPKEKQYVWQALDHNQLSCGPLTAAFEKKFARYHHRKFAIFCNSGTSALQVGLHALKSKYGWQDGDEVIVPSLTFVASVNVVLQNLLTPVLVDIEPDYYGINPALIEKSITNRTRAIMPVHLFGMPVDMDPILKLAKIYKLKIIEDSCETMFAHYRGKPVGSWGDVSCFSTYVAHLLVTGVGGLATTNDPDLALLMKSLLNHGRDGIYIRESDDDAARDTPQFADIVKRRFNFIRPGYSYRATELEGALGLAQIERWHKIIGGHQKNARYLIKHLAPYQKYLQLPRIRPHADHVYMMFPVVIKDPQKVKRDELIMYLENHGIETRYMLPLTNQPVYRGLWKNPEKNFPVATYINQNGFYVGCHQELKAADLAYMVKSFRNFFATIKS